MINLVPIPTAFACPRCGSEEPFEVECDLPATMVDGVPHVMPADVEIVCGYCCAVFEATEDGLRFVCLSGGI